MYLIHWFLKVEWTHQRNIFHPALLYSITDCHTHHKNGIFCPQFYSAVELVCLCKHFYLDITKSCIHSSEP